MYFIIELLDGTIYKRVESVDYKDEDLICLTFNTGGVAILMKDTVRSIEKTK